MKMRIGKREFLAGAAGLGAGLGERGAGANGAGARHGRSRPQRRRASPRRREIPVRKAKTVPLYLTPPGWPNAIATDAERGGFWVQEQRHDGEREKAWLQDWNGKLLKTVVTNSQNTSGMTCGRWLHLEQARTASR